MSTENSDAEIKRLFDELRTSEAHGAPSFSSIARERVSVRMSPRLRLAFGACAIVLLMAGIVFTVAQGRERRLNKEMQQWAAVSHWQASTDSLLNIASTPWQGGVTTPTDSLIDNSTNSIDSHTQNL